MWTTDTKMKNYNLIFLNTDKLLLSSKSYGSWRDIQNEFENYSSSIDFDNLEAVKEYIIMDYKLDNSSVERLITKFLESKLNVMAIDI